MSVQIAKHWFTVKEYDRMGETGIFAKGERVELIEGEILEMSPIGKRHAACVGRLNEIFGRQLAGKVIVWVQSPIQLNDYSEPQPDVVLLKRRDDFYEHAHPTPADVLLLVEVSDTTLEYDRQIKVPLYARSGVPEVWLVNLQEEQLEAYAQPAGGVYQQSVRAVRGEEISAQVATGLNVSVNELLG